MGRLNALKDRHQALDICHLETSLLCSHCLLHVCVFLSYLRQGLIHVSAVITTLEDQTLLRSEKDVFGVFVYYHPFAEYVIQCNYSAISRRHLNDIRSGKV